MYMHAHVDTSVNSSEARIRDDRDGSGVIVTKERFRDWGILPGELSR